MPRALLVLLGIAALVAIGGVGLDALPAVLATGVGSVAVVSAVTVAAATTVAAKRREVVDIDAPRGCLAGAVQIPAADMSCSRVSVSKAVSIVVSRRTSGSCATSSQRNSESNHSP